MMSCSKNISQVKREELGRALARVEYQYLDNQSEAVLATKQQLVRTIQHQLFRQHLSDIISSVHCIGSHAEGTAVATSGYDLHCCLKLTSSGVVEACEDNSYKKVYGGPPTLLDSKGYLSTVEAIKDLQKRIDYILQYHKIYFKDKLIHMTLETNNYMIVLNVSYERIELSVNISVALEYEHLRKSYSIIGFPNDLVARPEKAYGRSDLWKVSYSRNERDKLSKLDSEKLTLLRLMKLIKQHTPQLRPLSSFFLKHAFLKMTTDYPKASWSSPSDFPERFKDMVKVMFTSLKKSLPCFFDKGINCLQDVTDAEKSQCAGFLGSTIANDDYAGLVGAVPATSVIVPERVLTAYDEEGWGCALM
ncbi:uncharacterized protein [Watersipora subatra]|uniref:uncharacterized protein n=1 Tax=Watersipora subatra TaxID=2589382 RepID=UPI00355BFB22